MKDLANQIAAWLKNYAVNAKRQSLIIGVSGGVDSGLVSTLCAMTGMRTLAVTLPCESDPNGMVNAETHIEWLQKNFPNVERFNVDLTETFRSFVGSLPAGLKDTNGLAYANAKSRFRMISLYQVATIYDGLVVGTGNKVEDFGIGFFTKYGDGGVDISPIADLMKSEVRAMARELGVPACVANAIPTDGLWAGSPSDEDQIGATYDELEWAMNYISKGPAEQVRLNAPTSRQKEVLVIYNQRHAATAHKMAPIPTFTR